MKNKNVLILCSLLLTALMTSAAAQAKIPNPPYSDKPTYDCREAGGAREKMSFVIDAENKQIIMTNTEYFGIAEIAKITPMPMELTAEDTVEFHYDWYYSAQYTFKFEKPVRDHQRGDSLRLWLTFDDMDGASACNAEFKCTISH